MSVGDEILVRGPYGNHFPVETVLKGQDLLFIAGGIGLAPLRSVINYVLDNRDNYGTVDIVYGSRSKDDLVQLKEIQEVWAKAKDVNVHLTIDREQEGWDGHVGFVPNYVKELNMSVDKTALICGPPIMIKFVLQGLQELGYEKTQVYTTLELRMKCGIGKCGRCNIGDKYVCKDGPVFAATRLTNYRTNIKRRLKKMLGNGKYLRLRQEVFRTWRSDHYDRYGVCRISVKNADADAVTDSAVHVRPSTESKERMS